RVVQQQRVGAVVERGAATRRQEATLQAAAGTAYAAAALHAAGGEELGDVRCLAVADWYVGADQLGGVLCLQFGLGHALLVLGQLGLGRDPDDVAVTPLVQALRPQ